MHFGNKLALAVVAAASWVAGMATPAQAGITFFSDRATFNSAAGNLTGENFANLAVGLASGSFKFITVNPLNSTNADVVPGFSLVAAPAPQGGNPIGFLLLHDDFQIPGIAISSTNFNEDFSILFSPTVTAVGFDLFGFQGEVGPWSIDVSDASGLIGTDTLLKNGFFGVVVTGDSITSVHVPQPRNGNEIENLAFSSPAAPVDAVPEPATLAMLATGVIGLAGLHRRRRS